MGRSILICVTDDLSVQNKAREFGLHNNITVNCYSSSQWTEGLENPSFRSQHHTEPVSLKPGVQNSGGGKVIQFPNVMGDKKVATMNELESEAIKNAIAEYRGNLTEAAKALGIGRATLYRKVKQYNIDPSFARGKTAKAA